MAEAAQQPQTPEVSLTPEQQAARTADARDVVSTLFRQRVPEHPTSTQAQAIDANPAAKAIYSAQYLAGVDELSIRRHKGFSLEEGNPAKIIGSEGEGRLLEITGVDGDRLKCKYEVGSGDSSATFEESFTREQIQNSILVSEKSAIVNGFSGEQQAVVKAHLDSIDSSVKPEDREVPTAEALKKAAESAQMITAEDAQALIDALPPSTKNIPEVQDIIQRLDGRIFANADDFSALAHIISPDGASLDVRIDALHEDIRKMQAEADGLPDGDAAKAELQGKIADAQKQEAAFNQAQRVLLEEEAVAARTEQETKAEAENSPIGQIDQALDLRAQELAAKVVELDQIAAKERTVAQNEELQSAQHMLEYIDAVKALKGPFGVLAREAAIKKLLAHGKGELGMLSLKRLERAQREHLGAAKEQAGKDFVAALEDAEVPESQIVDAQELLANQKKLTEFLSGKTKDAKIQALLENPAVSNALLGGSSEMAIDNFMAKAEAALDPAQKRMWDITKKSLKIGGISAGGIALLLLALTGFAMTFVARGVSSDSRIA